MISGLTQVICGVLTLAFAISSSGQSQSYMSASSQLRKLSMSLKGLPPSRAEYAELDKLNEADSQKFLVKKAKLYLESQEFNLIFSQKIMERFKFRVSYKNWLDTSNHDYSNGESPRLDETDATQFLIADVLKSNKSWDQLYLAHEYSFLNYQKTNELGINAEDDFSFFSTNISQALTTSSASEPYLWSAKFPPDSEHIAGIFSTSRFINRYVNTAVNKNRKRAAAMYDILFCDPMSAAISIETSERKRQFLELAYPSQQNLTLEERLRAELKQSQETLHGTQKDCMACHSKLDPMGKTLAPMGRTLFDYASPGKLVLRRAQQDLEADVAGLRSLVKLAVQQPEYLNCQVQWFWNQFIGEDVPLPASVKNELVQNFVDVERKPLDFIAKLVARSEFKQKPNFEEVINFSRVKPLLKRCDTCHDSAGSFIPHFSVLPISEVNNPADTAGWLKKIQTSLLLPDTSRKKMPKDYKLWLQSDLQLLNKWLELGAPDENNVRLLIKEPQ